MAEVRGVLGPVDAAGLGLVLPHEHLFNDLSSAVAEPSYASTHRLVEAEVGPGWQFLLRQDPYCCADNVAAKDHASVVREVAAFAAAGGGTVVDATGSAAIGRDPRALAAVAEATGVTVIMGTGAYLEKFEGERITAVAVEAQTSRILAELDQGVGETGIRARRHRRGRRLAVFHRRGTGFAARRGTRAGGPAERRAQHPHAGLATPRA